MMRDRRGARLHPLFHEERGATAVEYGLILALIFLAVVGGVTSLGESVQGRWNDISDKVTAS